VSKKQFFKVTGFISTLAAGTALVASAATGTGAWFTDSEAGSLTAQAGHLTITTHDPTTLDFRGIMPGEDRDQTITYTVDSSKGAMDVWLKFDTTTAKYSQFTGYSAVKDQDGNIVTGGQNGYDDGGLGRYGHFMVSSGNSVFFNSYNLKNDPNGTSGCADNAKGWGSSAQAQGEKDTSMGYCGVPGYIKIGENLADGADGNVTLTFGLTGKQTQQNQIEIAGLPFEIVATQAGHRPDAANF
jgi:hypothetical protein